MHILYTHYDYGFQIIYHLCIGRRRICSLYGKYTNKMQNKKKYFFTFQKSKRSLIKLIRRNQIII